MKRWIRVLLLIGTVAAIMLACGEATGATSGTGGGGGTSTPQQQPQQAPATQAPTKKPAAPRVLLEVTGSENTQTKTINIPDGAVATWSMTPVGEGKQYGAGFTVFGQGVGGNLAFDQVAMTPTDTQPHSGTYVFHGGGDEYFSVTVANCSYTLKIVAP
jgi:hypothetical protein